MRNWDVRSSFGVDYYIANSEYIAKRIKKVYRRDSKVIYPNVEVDDFKCQSVKDDYYFTCSRMVPYKKISLIVEAFALMPNKKLIVIGDGPDMPKIKALATKNTQILGHQSFECLKQTMSSAKGFVFAAEEDFGIVPVEAQACGTPVIAFGKGGSLETVVEGETGLFFYEQSRESIIDAITRFESKKWNPIKARANAERFSSKVFEKNILEFIDNCLMEQSR
jgi:glycosyltransferase involved in cell wall biosynthesis